MGRSAPAGLYVKKLDCFCFTQQQIAAGENRELPVVLVVEPSIPRDVHTVTLSYTMFQIEGAEQRAAVSLSREGQG
jgi:cytochrome c oxidase assembly protein subunit 11